MLDNRAVSGQKDQGLDSLSEGLCGDIVSVLGVQRIPLVFQVLETFGLAEEAWAAARGNMMSEEAERGADQLRAHKLEAAPLSIDWRSLYSPGSFERLRNIVNAGYETNPKLLLLTSLWVEALSGRPIRGTAAAGQDSPFSPLTEHSKAEQEAPPFLSSNSRHPGKKHPGTFENALSSRLLLNEIAETYSSPGIPDDYHALAAYPEFLRIHWGSMKSHLRTPGYRSLKKQLIEMATVRVHELPYAVRLNFMNRDQQPFSDERHQETEKARLLEDLLLIQDQFAGLILELSFIRSSLR